MHRHLLLLPRVEVVQDHGVVQEHGESKVKQIKWLSAKSLMQQNSWLVDVTEAKFKLKQTDRKMDINFQLE